MAKAALLAEKDGHVLTVTINRPEKKNAVDAEVLCGLSDAWHRLDQDDELRVAILTGAGGVFCAGMDLSVIPKLRAGTADDEFEERLLSDGAVIFDGWLKSYRPTKPVIAAVEGYALAGGTEILQGTDIRVAGESAEFGITEVQRGLFPMAGSCVRLPRQIPYTVAPWSSGWWGGWCRTVRRSMRRAGSRSASPTTDPSQCAPSWRRFARPRRCPRPRPSARR
jgi:enoyl-CoA hydratase